jgi:hypothetical protein
MATTTTEQVEKQFSDLAKTGLPSASLTFIASASTPKYYFISQDQEQTWKTASTSKVPASLPIGKLFDNVITNSFFNPVAGDIRGEHPLHMRRHDAVDVGILWFGIVIVSIFILIVNLQNRRSV